MNVITNEVEVKTADGIADAVLYRVEGTSPGVLFLPDGIGLRQSQSDMARRLAGDGFNVLLPNIYYRTAKPPIFPPKPDLSDPKTRERFTELTSTLTPDAMVRDGRAYADFLSSQQGVREPLGVIGFCFTGAFALRLAAAMPDRIAAAASFHGGRLYQDSAASPHLHLPDVKGRLYFGHAENDASMPAEAIRQFEDALAEWGGRFESETYSARHGWTVPDSAAYDEPEAERAWRKIREFFAPLRQ